LRREISYRLTDVSEVHASISRLMVEAAGTSGTSVNFYETTQRNTPEDNHIKYKTHFFTF
jgi:hypothetical protein